MKKLSFILLLIFSGIFYSCSEEEDSLLNSDIDYFPLEVDNSWTYENQLNQESGNIKGSETLTVEAENENRFSFSQTENELAGIFTSILASGEVYKSNNNLITLDAELSIDLDNEFSNLEIPLDAIVLYDANLSQGSTMSFTSGEFQQDINGFPIDFIYEINSIHKGFILEEFVNGVSYEDVFVSEIQVSLSAHVFIVFSDFTILEKQDITSITNYYAKDIGLIKSEVSTEIIFEDIPEQLEIEIPDVNFTSSQKLTSHTFNPNS